MGNVVELLYVTTQKYRTGGPRSIYVLSVTGQRFFMVLARAENAQYSTRVDGAVHHLISSDFSLEAAAIRPGLHLSLGLHHLTLLHSPSVPFISKGDRSPVPVQMYFSVRCVCAPLFIISIELRSYVETLVVSTSHCAKCAARK